MTRLAKTLLSLAALICIGVVIQLMVFLYSRNEVNTLTNQNQLELEIYQQIESHYLDLNQGFIDENVSQETVDEIYSKIIRLGEEENVSSHLVNNYNDLLVRYVANREVNKLYQSGVIRGDRIQINAPLIEEISLELVYQVQDVAYFDEPADAFQHAINSQIDYALEQVTVFEQTLSELDDVFYIPIEPRNYNLLARAMAEAEELYGLVNNSTLVTQLDNQFQIYGQEFMETLIEQNDDIANNPLILEAVRPSDYFLRIVQELQRN